MVQQYLDHAREILTSDDTLFKGGTKGMGLISLSGYQNKYDLSKGFPLLTTKKMAWKGVVHELLWFMRGESNIKYLVDNNVHIWDDNAFDYNVQEMVGEKIFPESSLSRYSADWQKAKAEYVQRIKEDTNFAARWGDCGDGTYGKQWRHWKYVDKKGDVKEIDQLAQFVETLQKKPTTKKNIVSAWNPAEIYQGNVALEPCHVLYKSSSDGNIMDLHLFQRSCDQFLGVPYNVSSYSMFAIILAQQAGLLPRKFIHTFDDAHFYCGDGARSEWYGENLGELKKRVREVKHREEYLEVLDWVEKSVPPERKETEGQDHVTAILQQLAREPRPLPTMRIAKKDFDKLTIDDFVLEGYNPHPTIKRAMAV